MARLILSLGLLLVLVTVTGVQVSDASGSYLATIAVPRQPANLACRQGQPHLVHYRPDLCTTVSLNESSINPRQQAAHNYRAGHERLTSRIPTATSSALVVTRRHRLTAGLLFDHIH